MRKINTFLSLGFNKQLMFIEAFILSGYYRFAMIYLPFKYLKNQMGIPKTESPSQVDDPAMSKLNEFVQSCCLLVNIHLGRVNV